MRLSIVGIALTAVAGEAPLPPAMPLLADYSERWAELVAPRPPPPSMPDRCEGWCDPIWPTQHCADERCGLCGFCRARIGCSGTFCDPSAAEQHCLKGECSTCAFCSNVCPRWCQARYADVHCAVQPSETRTSQLSCHRCDFCAARERIQAAAAAAGGIAPSAAIAPPSQCANWCRARNADVHCKETSCAGCDYCVAGNLRTPPPPPTTEVPVATRGAAPQQSVPPATAAPRVVAPPPAAECASWCRARYADVHCQERVCLGCLFCVPQPMVSVSATDPRSVELLPPPPSTQTLNPLLQPASPLPPPPPRKAPLPPPPPPLPTKLPPPPPPTPSPPPPTPRAALEPTSDGLWAGDLGEALLDEAELMREMRGEAAPPAPASVRTNAEWTAGLSLVLDWTVGSRASPSKRALVAGLALAIIGVLGWMAGLVGGVACRIARQLARRGAVERAFLRAGYERQAENDPEEEEEEREASVATRSRV